MKVNDFFVSSFEGDDSVVLRSFTANPFLLEGRFLVMIQQVLSHMQVGGTHSLPSVLYPSLTYTHIYSRITTHFIININGRQ